MKLALGEGNVHVWVLSLDAKGPDEGLELLNEQETGRAARFLRASDRQRYVAARSALRILLSRYVGEQPGKLVFRSGRRGKPELVRRAGQAEIFFNLTHSGQLVAIAVSRAMPVGIDVEKIDPTLDIDALAPVSLSAAEQASLRRLGEEDRRACFYAAWVCKEAVLKAMGCGVSERLKQVEVDVAALADTAACTSQRFDISMDADGPWRVQRLEVRDGYVGAVAAPVRQWAVLSFEASAGLL
jgi:4'-phosphopantetheinyl transferase